MSSASHIWRHVVLTLSDHISDLPGSDAGSDRARRLPNRGTLASSPSAGGNVSLPGDEGSGSAGAPPSADSPDAVDEATYLDRVTRSKWRASVNKCTGAKTWSEFPREVRPLVGQTFVSYLRSLDHDVAAVAVGAGEVQLICRLPLDSKKVRWILGRAKSVVSRYVRPLFDGKVWVDGGRFRPLESSTMHVRAVDALKRLARSDRGCWYWTDDDLMEQIKTSFGE